MSIFRFRTVFVGLAMFSMFFGAGNVIFPLLLGQAAGDQTLLATLGMLVTAVAVPFLGVLAMVLFDADYKSFFGRMGRVPGALVTAAILLVIGPFGGIPRCIALSHATLNLSVPELPLWLFGAVACGLVYLCAVRKSRVVGLLGYILTPVLLISLLVIAVRGLFGGDLIPSDQTPTQAFLNGVQEGYNTLDLLAAFFFSTVVTSALKRWLVRKEESEEAYRGRVFKTMLQASVIGASLLAIVYAGLAYAAAAHGAQLQHVASDQLLGALAFHLLGSWAGIVANITVCIACLTTAITLAVIFSDLLSRELLGGRVGYRMSLLLTLAIAYFVSYLKVTGIVQVLAPMLVVAYPALIVLTLLNIFYKMRGFQPVHLPFYGTIALSSMSTLLVR